MAIVIFVKNLFFHEFNCRVLHKPILTTDEIISHGISLFCKVYSLTCVDFLTETTLFWLKQLHAIEKTKYFFIF